MTSPPSEHCLTLELTGPLERLIGIGVVELPVAAGDSLGDVLAALVDRYPGAAAHLAAAAELRRGDGALPPGFLVVRDGAAVAARLDWSVTPGDRLTLLSLISGG